MSEDGTKSLLRARLAFSPKEEKDPELFTIVTLDFKAAPEKTKAIIANADNLSQQDLLSLLSDPSTVPKLIHVSLESGKDASGKSIGKRYEYSEDAFEELTDSDKAEFLSTLDQAYMRIVSKL